MISVQSEDVDIGKLIEGAKQRGTGAIVLFDGIVRDDDIREMELEAYRDVALAELERIAEEAKKNFGLLSVDIVHRVGRLAVGDNILVILVGAGHRREAYEGSRFIIEAIKAGVPIWKKEISRDGSSWVEGDRG
ncbi:MAG TPA: molybdenum cofactor biosynthesis protein MoaE [Methanomicrobiales archaeon]|jgi:molybdopterin synthase catalytic subunit|nr:molybdenum cofactor biosynthesis protein MoaE [Methanomicrobiales archaeon]